MAHELDIYGSNLLDETLWGEMSFVVVHSVHTNYGVARMHVMVMDWDSIKNVTDR